MSREKHDWTIFTDNIGSIDLYGKAFRRAFKADTYGGKTIFKAVALTDMFPLSSAEAMAIDGGSTGTSGKERYAFKGRIIGANSPHSFLPDPCDPAFVPDNNAAYRTIALHTTFISTNVIEVDPVTRGDIVLVELEKTDLAYDLEYGRFLSVTSQEAPTDTAGTQCYSLKDLVGEWGAPTPGTMAGVAGQTSPLKDTSAPSYTACASEKRQTKITMQALADIVKANVANASVAKSIIAMAITEQPAGSMIGGFNYNHFGIMADHGAKWGAPGRSYIKCAVPSTEGAGGSGNRAETNRWFAAFASTENSVKFVSETISKRGDKDEAGKKLHFTTIDNGIDFAKLHTLRWLSPSDKRERIKDLSKMQGKAANWDKAVTLYNNSTAAPPPTQTVYDSTTQGKHPGWSWFARDPILDPANLAKGLLGTLVATEAAASISGGSKEWVKLDSSGTIISYEAG